MICNNNYLADIGRACDIKDLIWVMRFQSPLVYLIKYVLDINIGSFDKTLLNMQMNMATITY